MPSFAFWKNTKEDERDTTVSIDVTQPAQVDVLQLDPGDQDSGVFLLDEKDTLVERYTSADPPAQEADRNGDQATPGIALLHAQTPIETFEVDTPTTAPVVITQAEAVVSNAEKREPNSALKSAHSQDPIAIQRTNTTGRRLHRPTELNLSTPAGSESKERSELEKRFDMIRNSKTQSKAALRSPTQLLRERLNMSPRKSKHEEVVRVFVAPRLSNDGCLLPGPGGQLEAFKSTSIRARTEASDRPAWWCKIDKLVVFDSIEIDDGGEARVKTRTSKGLSIARRRGDTETIVIPMACAHCREMLNRQEWKYDIQICKRSVCWDCKERCKWESEQEILAREESRTESSRYRADSVLQEDEIRDEDLMVKIGIEQARPRSPIEAVGGIAERLGSMEIPRK